ncbi:SDR family NAD(P)-dependent oxidoreductase [Polymorphobacter sp.]|uniref:SDR family NAD(P)-dependent oxidoreductase n=1 Tax=Polymorphobacter sp. TaxID=1909290 RepID=UPI003F72CA06
MSGVLSGQVALVTGASGGIGSAAARALAREGALVGVHAFRNHAGAAATVAAITEAGGQAVALSGDCAVAADAEAMVAALVAAFGRVDILVNCAGAAPKQPFGEVTAEGFTAMMNDNLLSALLMMQAVVATFGERGGRIVNVSSNLAYGPMPGIVPYCAAKAALSTMTQGFARELAGRNIAINAVAPGATETPMTEWIPDDMRAGIAAATPLGRLGQPADIADIIVFLASPAARWVNGRTIIADGGLV